MGRVSAFQDWVESRGHHSNACSDSRCLDTVSCTALSLPGGVSDEEE